ncbi:unnamed protein product [Acanthoscelides obtectus]|uniref:Uncharacterized protein n=1 Tax=Acanthoscelides obtectus TaxID=200917 RepID=A0A9P0LRZ1_ACAOB|nr:unnamed protein product [Acanthoscelides obtectus]CAK1654454.1 hypothetical protein AOBTE_LOCUS18610 [Acanthoscelides obtectus]
MYLINQLLYEMKEDNTEKQPSSFFFSYLSPLLAHRNQLVLPKFNVKDLPKLIVCSKPLTTIDEENKESSHVLTNSVALLQLLDRYISIFKTVHHGKQDI